MKISVNPNLSSKTLTPGVMLSYMMSTCEVIWFGLENENTIILIAPIRPPRTGLYDLSARKNACNGYEVFWPLGVEITTSRT